VCVGEIAENEWNENKTKFKYLDYAYLALYWKASVNSQL